MVRSRHARVACLLGRAPPGHTNERSVKTTAVTWSCTSIALNFRTRIAACLHRTFSKSRTLNIVPGLPYVSLLQVLEPHDLLQVCGRQAHGAGDGCALIHTQQQKHCTQQQHTTVKEKKGSAACCCVQRCIQRVHTTSHTTTNVPSSEVYIQVNLNFDRIVASSERSFVCAPQSTRDLPCTCSTCLTPHTTAHKARPPSGRSGSAEARRCGVVVIRVACKNRVGTDLSRPFPPPPARVSGLLQRSPVALYTKRYPITNQQR